MFYSDIDSVQLILGLAKTGRANLKSATRQKDIARYTGYLYALTDALGVILLEREWKETGKPVQTGEHYNHAYALVWGKETE